MNSEVALVLVSWGTQVQPQIILDPDYLPDYLSVSYDFDLMYHMYEDVCYKSISMHFHEFDLIDYFRNEKSIHHNR